LITPTRAFIIFEHDVTKDVIVDEKRKISFPSNHPFGETTLIFKQARDPTIIIHEDTNGHFNKSTKRWLTYLCIMVLGWAYLQLFVKVSQMSIEINYIRLPPGVDCSTYLSTDARENKQLAYFQYLEFEKAYATGFIQTLVTPLDSRIKKDGYLPCFCQSEKDMGEPADKEYGIPEFEEKPMCGQWNEYNGFAAKIVSSSVNYVIVIMNVVMRTFFMALARTMNFKTKS
jgi:hypothetical protein